MANVFQSKLQLLISCYGSWGIQMSYLCSGKKVCLGQGWKLLWISHTSFYSFFFQTTSLWVRVTTPRLTVPWAHGPGSPRIYWLLISQKQQRQPVKLTSAILKNTISFPGPDNFETCTGHLAFYFNLISPSLISGNSKQKIRGHTVICRSLKAALACPFTVHWETPCDVRH